MLTYEGHDEPQRRGGPNPKEVDQPLTTPRGSWTENGKFFRAAMDFKSGLREKPELIKVYEKISRGIWSYKGFFELIDANIVSDGKRKVFKFSLKPVEKKSFGRVVELPHNRLIPTPVKVEVWRRDRGQVRAMRFNEESSLRSRHSVFERRQQSDRGECSIALRQAQSREIRQDSVDRAVDFRRRCSSAADSQAFQLSRWRVDVDPTTSRAC